VTYQWLRNGWVDAGGPLKSGMAQPGVAGIYAAVATDQGLSAESKAAIVAPLISERLAGDGKIVGTNIRHPNGNIYDQMQPTGFGMSATAEPGEVLRISYCDETDDIVQVEFSGAGTLSLLVVGGGPPAEARSYNQPGVQYVRGHAHIVIGGADESTNVAVFTVGRVTAVNQTLFRDDVAYDGVADVASLAIVSRNGKFGGIYGGNANFTAGDGFTGVYAPGVEFLGPVRIHNVRARANARPLLVTGHVAEIFIGGGDMERANAGPVEVGDVGRLRFVDAVDSHGRTLPAQGNRGRYVRDGVDVTSRIAP
jgi:hypothetical protein